MNNFIKRIKDLIFPEWTYIYEVYKYKYSNDYIVSCFRFNKKGKVQEMIRVKNMLFKNFIYRTLSFYEASYIFGIIKKGGNRNTKIIFIGEEPAFSTWRGRWERP